MPAITRPLWLALLALPHSGNGAPEHTNTRARQHHTTAQGHAEATVRRPLARRGDAITDAERCGGYKRCWPCAEGGCAWSPAMQECYAGDACEEGMRLGSIPWHPLECIHKTGTCPGPNKCAKKRQCGTCTEAGCNWNGSKCSRSCTDKGKCTTLPSICDQLNPEDSNSDVARYKIPPTDEALPPEHKLTFSLPPPRRITEISAANANPPFESRDTDTSQTNTKSVDGGFAISIQDGLQYNTNPIQNPDFEISMGALDENSPPFSDGNMHMPEPKPPKNEIQDPPKYPLGFEDPVYSSASEETVPFPVSAQLPPEVEPMQGVEPQYGNTIGNSQDSLPADYPDASSVIIEITRPLSHTKQPHYVSISPTPPPETPSFGLSVGVLESQQSPTTQPTATGVGKSPGVSDMTEKDIEAEFQDEILNKFQTPDSLPPPNGDLIGAAQPQDVVAQFEPYGPEPAVLDTSFVTKFPSPTPTTPDIAHMSKAGVLNAVPSNLIRVPEGENTEPVQSSTDHQNISQTTSNMPPSPLSTTLLATDTQITIVVAGIDPIATNDAPTIPTTTMQASPTISPTTTTTTTTETTTTTTPTTTTTTPTTTTPPFTPTTTHTPIPTTTVAATTTSSIPTTTPNTAPPNTSPGPMSSDIDTLDLSVLYGHYSFWKHEVDPSRCATATNCHECIKAGFACTWQWNIKKCTADCAVKGTPCYRELSECRLPPPATEAVCKAQTTCHACASLYCVWTTNNGCRPTCNYGDRSCIDLVDKCSTKETNWLKDLPNIFAKRCAGPQTCGDCVSLGCEWDPIQSACDNFCDSEKGCVTDPDECKA